MKKTKLLLPVILILALVFCFSMGALAASSDIVVKATEDDGNHYKVTGALQDASKTNDLWIGTLKQWKAAGNKTFGTGTFFDNGEAIHDNDIIITNGVVGAVLAVGTRNPWGYPAGSILDAGTVNKVGNKIEANRDTVWSVEFLIDGWDAWAPDNCGEVVFDLVKYDFAAKKLDDNGDIAVQVSRKYTLRDTDLDVVTYYGALPGENYIRMYDQVINNKNAEATFSGRNRLAMTNKGDDGGAMAAIDAKQTISSYGMKTDETSYSAWLTLPGPNTSELGDSFAFNRSGGSVGYKELRTADKMKAKDRVTYDAYLVMSNDADTAALDAFLNAYNGGTMMDISGTVNSAATLNSKSAVILQKVTGSETKTYGWTMVKNGQYSFKAPALAAGEKYQVYLESYGLAPSSKVEVLASGTNYDLTAGKIKDDITINLKDSAGEAVWGKVELKNEYPVVRFTNDSIFQATTKGKIEAKVNDIGDFDATVFGEGYYFYSSPVSKTEADVTSGALNVTIDMKYAAPENWYSGDVHHHANKNDAFADPADLIPSILASGLDIALTSDHDFTVNNNESYELVTGKYAGALDGFVPSEEISASWAHFNVLPQTVASYNLFLDTAKQNKVMNQFARFQTFVDQTHEAGATITANHPWYSYGLFYAESIDAVPGGYSDDFDTIELNACCDDIETVATINDATNFWNAHALPYINFTDVPDDAWYLEYLDTLVALGAVDGYGNGIFEPDNNITRAEFAKAIDYLGDYSGNINVSFSDVDENHWAVDSIMRLASAGAIDGYPDGTFRPEDPITRAEASQLVYKAYKIAKGTPAKPFSDLTEEWYKEAINSLTVAEIVHGYDDGTFKPNNYIIRAETMKLVALANGVANPKIYKGDVVAKAHYLVGGSDTHDVLYPSVANNKGSSAVYHSGKSRTYAYIDPATKGKLFSSDAVKDTGLLFSQQVAAGQSYTSYGPILDPDKIFGKTYEVAANGKFEFAIDIESLNGVQDIVVLSNLAPDGEEGQYTYNTDKEYTIENVLEVKNVTGSNVNEYAFNYSYDLSELAAGQTVWFAVMVVDKSDAQMFAITNPYWVTIK